MLKSVILRELAVLQSRTVRKSLVSHTVCVAITPEAKRSRERIEVAGQFFYRFAEKKMARDRMCPLDREDCYIRGNWPTCEGG